jgi:hypothetical protein
MRASIPTSQSTFDTTKLLSLGDAEIRSYILPLLLRSREYYLAYDDDRTVNSTGVYILSPRAVGSKLINAALLDGTTIQELTWITEDELYRLDQAPRGIPGIYIKRNAVILVPATEHGFSQIRLTMSIRPGNLVATTSAAQITAIDTGTNTLTFSSIPSTFLTTLTYDIIQSQPHFDHISIDQVSSSITSTTMVFSSLSSRIAVGDWVSVAQTSPVVQVPADLQPLLEQKVSASILRFQGDKDSAMAAEAEVKRMQDDTMALYVPRVDKAGKKISMRNHVLRRL